MKISLSVLLFSFSLVSVAQNYSVRKVFQYKKDDSLNMWLAAVESYDSIGRLTNYHNQGYGEGYYQGWTTGRYTNIYRDSLLIQTNGGDLYDFEGLDSVKTYISYNSKGLKTQETKLDYKKRLTEKTKARLKKSGGGVTFEEDYLPYRTWDTTNVCTYEYDSLNRLIYFHDTFGNQTERWKFNDKNQIAEHTLHAHEWLVWVSKYEYFNGGYKFVQTWYDDDDIPMHTLKPGDGYQSQYTSTFLFNDNGQVVEETIKRETGELYYRKITVYDSKGNIARVKWYHQNDELYCTQIMQYE